LKRTVCFILGILCLALSGSAQEANLYKLEKLYQPQVASNDLVLWSNESYLLPIRFDSRSQAPVSISYTGPDAEVEIFLLQDVWADFSAGNCGSSKRNGEFEKVLVPDRAEKLSEKAFVPTKLQQWLLVKLNLKGRQKGDKSYAITFTQGGVKTALRGKMKLVDRQIEKLPTSKFYTDFWHFPMAVADYYQYKPWSTTHWNALDQMFEQLAAINQHSITVSVFWDLYNSRLRGLDEMIIQVKRDAGGNYSYNYEVFDRYVELGLKHGLNRQIAIHNLFPWNNMMFYWDEPRNQMVSRQAAPGTEAYREFWKPLIFDLVRHLKEKNWMSNSLFFVDERDHVTTIDLILWARGLVPEMQFGYSGRFYPSMTTWAKDYSIPMNVVVDPVEMKKRVAESKFTSLYTSCYEKANQPNILMTSDLRDIYFLSHLVKAKGYQGMLHWAFNLWSPGISENAIYSDVPSGDAHLVYPNGQVSLRYLVLIDAIEELSKFEVLETNNSSKEMISSMNRYFLINIESDRHQMVQALKKYLNE